MACTPDIFRVRFPEFADETEYPEARIQLFLDDAANCYMGTDENRWCGKYDVAQCYLAAHLLSTATVTEASGGVGTSGTTGPITQKTAGGVSVTRTANTKERSDQDEFYMSSAYGQQFILLRNSCFAGVTVANCL